MLHPSGPAPSGSLTVMEGQIGAREQICGDSVCLGHVNFSVVINHLLLK